MDEGSGVDATIYSIQRALTLFLIPATVVCFPILAGTYYYYRRHPILRARKPGWAVLSQFLISCGMVSYGYDAWRHYPTCAQILFTNSVISMLALDSHIIRCWLLLYNWHVSKALCAQTAGDSGSSNWWLRNTHLASNRVMASCMAGLTVIHLCCWLLFNDIHGWDKSWNEPADTAICTSPLLWFFGVWGALACLMTIAVYLSYNMRLIVDAFDIRNELMTSGAIWLVGAMPFWFVALIFPSVQHVPNYVIMTGLSVELCGIRVLYLNLIKPLLMIWKENRERMHFELSSFTRDSMDEDAVQWTPTMTHRTVNDRSRKVELRKMLDMNTGIAGSFIEFLTKEFSVENWKFYSDVQQLRTTYGGWTPAGAGQSGLTCGNLDWFRAQATAIVALEASINRIYAVYLAKSAPFEINLSGDRMRDLQACFGPDHLLKPQRIDDIPELLCRAQDEIYELMRTDSYERFKKTTEFDQAQLALV